MSNSSSTPEPETTPEPESKPETTSEPKTLFPEIMTNQEAFLMYGIFIFLLAVFCVVLLILFIRLKKKINKLSSSAQPMAMKAPDVDSSILRKGIEETKALNTTL